MTLASLGKTHMVGLNTRSEECASVLVETQRKHKIELLFAFAIGLVLNVAVAGFPASWFTELSADAPVQPGAWNLGFEKCKRYCDEHNVPLFAVWGTRTCVVCTEVHMALLSETFKSFMQQGKYTDVVYCIMSSGDEGAEASSVDQHGSEAWSWMRYGDGAYSWSWSGSLKDWPFVAFYWKGGEVDHHYQGCSEWMDSWSGEEEGGLIMSEIFEREFKDFSGSVTITNVSVRQIEPWRGLVEINYELTEDVSNVTQTVKVRDIEHGMQYEATEFLRQPTFEKGLHRLIWNTKADGCVFASTAVVVMVSHALRQQSHAEEVARASSVPIALDLRESSVHLLQKGQGIAVECSPLFVASDADVDELTASVLTNGVVWQTSHQPTNFSWSSDARGVFVLTHEVRQNGELLSEPLVVTNVVGSIDESLVLASADVPLRELYPETYACYTTVEIAEGVTEVVSNCFAGCYLLQSIDLPSTVTNVGECAFVGCPSIRSVKMGLVPMGAGLIGATLSELFPDSAGQLEKVVLRDTVDELPGNFFSNCAGLRQVIFQGDAPKVSVSSFDGVNCSVLAYTDTQGWGDGLNWDGKWKGLPVVWVSRNLAFAGAGDVGWTLQFDVSRSGEAWQSGAVTNRGVSSLTAKVFGTGTISFCWKRQMVSNGRLQFFVDGEQIGDNVTENIDWTTVRTEVTGETLHTFEWRYSAARSNVDEDDAGWVDEIRWSPDVDTPCRVVYDIGTSGQSLVVLEQNIAYGTYSTVPDVWANPGWRFLGWDQTLGFVTNDAVVTALYEPIVYSIAYDLGGVACANAGNPISYTVTNAVTFAAPTDYDANAWTFSGWSPNGIAVGSTGDKSAAAQWERTPHTIAISGKPGASSVSGRYGDTVVLANPYNVTNGCTNVFCIGWTGSGCVPSEGSSNRVEVVLSGEGAIDWICQTNVLFENHYNVTNGLTNVVCVGWVGTGCAPSYGCSNSVIVNLTGPCTVDWIYQTNVCLVASGTHGTISPQVGWFDMDLAESLVLNFTPEPGWQLYAWIVDGIEQAPVSPDTSLLLTMDAAHAVGVVTRRTLSLTFDVAGSDAEWQKIADGVYQSGTIGNGAQSDLAITVEGPASVSFDWKVSSEDGFDYLYYYIDGGTSKKKITGETEWETLSFDVGEGTHEIRWSFVKDEVDEDPVGQNCGWVRNVTVNGDMYRYSVRFETGTHGDVPSGEALQAVPWGGAAVAPTVATETGWRLKGWSSSYSNVTANVVVQAIYVTDFLRDLGDDSSAEDVAAALDEATDKQVQAKVNETNYADFREWAGKVKTTSGDPAGVAGVKTVPHAWLSYALDQDTLLSAGLTDADLTIVSFSPATESGLFDFQLTAGEIFVGPTATPENLAKVFGLEGASVLRESAFSTDNVEIEFGTPVDGKVKFTAGPKATALGTFFMKVRMLP